MSEDKCGSSRDGDFCRLEASGQCPQEANNRANYQSVCPLLFRQHNPQPLPDTTEELAEKEIVFGIRELGKVCSQPEMLAQMKQLAFQLEQKFIAYADRMRLLQSNLKENVTL